MEPPSLGDGDVTFVIESLELVEGTYKLDVAVHKSDGYPYDYHRLLYTFRVKSRVRIPVITVRVINGGSPDRIFKPASRSRAHAAEYPRSGGQRALWLHSSMGILPRDQAAEYASGLRGKVDGSSSPTASSTFFIRVTFVISTRLDVGRRAGGRDQLGSLGASQQGA